MLEKTWYIKPIVSFFIQKNKMSSLLNSDLYI